MMGIRLLDSLPVSTKDSGSGLHRMELVFQLDP